MYVKRQALFQYVLLLGVVLCPQMFKLLSEHCPLLLHVSTPFEQNHIRFSSSQCIQYLRV